MKVYISNMYMHVQRRMTSINVISRMHLNLFFTQVCSSVTQLYLPHIFHLHSKYTYLIQNGSLILPEAASFEVIRCFALKLTKYACISV